LIFTLTWQQKTRLINPTKVNNQSVIKTFDSLHDFLDKTTRLSNKSDQESAHPSSRDNSQINCFFKACDREASEKLLHDSYIYSTYL
jgi:hypothetical protein